MTDAAMPKRRGRPPKALAAQTEGDHAEAAEFRVGQPTDEDFGPARIEARHDPALDVTYQDPNPTGTFGTPGISYEVDDERVEVAAEAEREATGKAGEEAVVLDDAGADRSDFRDDAEPTANPEPLTLADGWFDMETAPTSGKPVYLSGLVEPGVPLVVPAFRHNTRRWRGSHVRWVPESEWRVLNTTYPVPFEPKCWARYQ